MTTGSTQDGHAGVIEYHANAGGALKAKIEAALGGLTARPERPADVARAFGEMRFEASDVEACGEFSPGCYGRIEIARSEAWVVLAMFWDSCETCIHDHCESNCGFHIVRGEIEETRFKEEGEGEVTPIAKRRLAEGTFGTSNRSAIHQLSTTAESGHRAISVHAYCPVLDLDAMNQYEACEETERAAKGD